MDPHATYFIILAGSVAGPLALSFDKKVAFYTKWKYLFPSMLVPALLYIVWDIYFTAKGIWSFNQDFITGIKLVNLPVEEVLFFVVVPYCCLFIYECIRCYFPNLRKSQIANRILQSLGAALIVAGLAFYNKDYTCWTFVLCGVYITVLYSFRRTFKNFDAASFLSAFLVILIPFLVVNGFLTAIPVVLYNNDENLGVRVYTIPFEDIFYGMLLVLMNISIYEKLRSR